MKVGDKVMSMIRIYIYIYIYIHLEKQPVLPNELYSAHTPQSICSSVRLPGLTSLENFLFWNYG